MAPAAHLHLRIISFFSSNVCQGIINLNKKLIQRYTRIASFVGGESNKIKKYNSKTSNIIAKRQEQVSKRATMGTLR